MKILQINTADRGGGAEGSAWNLFESYRKKGHESLLAVGRKFSDDPDVIEIPLSPVPGLRGSLFQFLQRFVRRRGVGLPGARRLERWLGILADPQRLADWSRGVEDFNFPGSRRLLTAVPWFPDVVHCHNLHGWYFDLRCLSELSRRVPVILNLRDAWLLTGHCGYFLDCERWRTGCSECPYLHLYPAVRRDATAQNWETKRKIYSSGRFYVTAPSRWLIDCVTESMLDPEECRVIPNGIDLDVFTPGDRAEARKRLELPADIPIVLCAAASKRNLFKDPRTMARTLGLAADQFGRDSFLAVCLGTEIDRSTTGSCRLKCIPYVDNPRTVADYYRAADVFIHTARAEAFGKTVTEAMACGTPVVASNTGGIAEQILENETGYLVPAGDAETMARRVLELFEDATLRARLGQAAAERAGKFGLDAQVDAFMSWYGDVIRDYAS